MRPLATSSTVPTWTPSAPITSMFLAILSLVIWSLLWFLPIVLELGVLRQAENRECQRARGRNCGGEVPPVASREGRHAKRTARTRTCHCTRRLVEARYGENGLRVHCQT